MIIFMLEIKLNILISESIDESDNFRKMYNILNNLKDIHNVQIYNCNCFNNENDKIEKYKETLLYKAKRTPKISHKIPTRELNEYKISKFYKNVLIKFVKELKKRNR